MVPGWKNSTSLRLLLSDNFENTMLLKNRWERRLRMLRIECQLEIINWEENSLGPYEIDFITTTDWEKEDYFQKINSFIRSYSEHSDLVFLYLPTPPRSREGYKEYLRYLTLITENLPPTIMANGITEVTSDSL